MVVGESQRNEVTVQGPTLGLGDTCAPILWGLPQWFGIESATRHYIESIDELPTFTAMVNGELAGFLTLKQHFEHSAEIYVMGVAARFHRRGCGRAMLMVAESYLCEQGIEYLQVKTLSPSHPDEYYALTRKFYAAVGFRPLEEFKTLWGEANPCLLLVKRLG
jgi:ribosomal protein S18 acetylase RimI-like enzyme